MLNLITIGDAVIDTHVQIDDATVECAVDGGCKLCLEFAGKIPIKDSFQNVGGNAANVAAGAVKLGLKSAILTTVGADSNGKMIGEELGKLGVDTTLVGFDSKVKTRYSIILNFKSERTILSYHQKRNYLWPADIPAADWIYFTSLSDGFEPLQEKVLSLLDKRRTLRLAYNPGSFQLKNALEKAREMVEHTDLLIVNLEEAEKLAGITLKKEKNVPALVHKLLNMGAKEVAITDAARGAFAADEDEVWHLPAYPVKVAAKTGAGDSFSAGFLSARFYGHDTKEALLWGIANSSAVITEPGALKGLQDKKGIAKMIAKFPKINPELLV